MSYESDKGYRLERDTREWFRDGGHECDRPRTTSRRNADTGDMRGLPFVVSCKNRARTDLSAWVDELVDMIARSDLETGFVVHKRRGRGDRGEQYVTLTLDMMKPFIDAYAVIRALGR